ncbi:MAG: Enolase [Microgenomates bacterium OLB22]|nr:MAG: Enolase [Microgenomates bacterium OLB22]
MPKISKIMAHEIIDSRGVPTIRAYLGMDTGRYVKAEIPSGKALSKYEPQEIRDGDPARYEGQGVQVALRYINDLIGPKLIGASVDRIHEIDKWLLEADGTENRSKLGSNTILAISLLLLKAGAKDAGVPVYVYINQLYKSRHEEAPVIQNIPAPIVNLINGGSHGSKTLDFQEFHIIPSTSLSFAKALEHSVAIYQNIQHVLEYRNVGTFSLATGRFYPSATNKH